jgi:hypothetical protein
VDFDGDDYFNNGISRGMAASIDNVLKIADNMQIS